MGCDYYIVKALEILLTGEKYPLTIELERDYGYFNFFIDSDDPAYDTKLNEFKIECLKPVMLPIVIYENGDFLNENLRKKFSHVVEEELFLNKRSWEEVEQIIKMEYRYERD